MFSNDSTRGVQRVTFVEAASRGGYLAVQPRKLLTHRARPSLTREASSSPRPCCSNDSTDSGWPKAILIGRNRGHLRVSGHASKLPLMYTGTTGTRILWSNTPTPRRKVCSSPSGERRPSGNQTSTWPLARTFSPSRMPSPRSRSGSTGNTPVARLTVRKIRPLCIFPAHPAQRVFLSTRAGNAAESTTGSR